MNKHNSFYKIFSLLLAVTMLIGLLLFSALSVTAAEPHIVFTIGDAAGKPGDTVEIPISVTGDTEVSGLVLYQITYDKDNLEFLGFGSYGELIAANAAGESAVGDETITLGYSTDLVPNGAICIASFKIKDTAPDGDYTVSFSIFSASRTGIEVSNTLNAGTLTVSRWLNGDFDNNGVLNMQDAVHFIGWINFSYIPGLYPMIYDGDKDFNHDGAVDMQDAVYFIGWVNFSYIPGLYTIDWYGKTTCRHTMQATAAKAASCTENGNIAYWYCTACEKYFADEAGKTEISIEDIVIKATGHTYASAWSYDDNYHWHAATCGCTDAGVTDYGEHSWDSRVVTKEASYTETGTVVYTCSVCQGTYTVTLPKLTYSVTFLDYDGSIFFIAEAESGATVTAPENIPGRSGYCFEGWYLNGVKLADGFALTVSGNMTLTAGYVRQYTVTFKDWDERVIETQQVISGGNASYPTHPERTGYDSDGWDGEITGVTSDRVIMAKYQIRYYTVTFVLPNGSVIDSQSVAHGGDAYLPIISGGRFCVWDKSVGDYTETVYGDICFDWDGDVQGAYSFTGWSSENYKNVTAETVITALFGNAITDPAFVMQDVTVNRQASEATVYFYLFSDKPLSGFSAAVSFDEKVSIKSCTLNDNLSSVFCGNSAGDHTNHPHSEIIRGSSVNVAGVSLGDSFTPTAYLYEIKINPSGLARGVYRMEISVDSYYIDGNLTQGTPITVSGILTVK